MKEFDLFEAFGGIDLELLERLDQCDAGINGKEQT